MSGGVTPSIKTLINYTMKKRLPYIVVGLIVMLSAFIESLQYLIK